MGPRGRGQTLLAIGLALLLVTSGCSGLFEEDPDGELVWETPRPAAASPTATPTVDVDDAINLTRRHHAQLHNRSYHLSAIAVTRHNGTVVGTSNVTVDREQDRLHYRHTLEGEPAVALGFRYFRRGTLDAFAMYGEGKVVHYRAVTDADGPTVRRLRNVSQDGELGDPLSAREVRGPFLTLRDHLFEFLATVAAITTIVPEPAGDGYRFEVGPQEVGHTFWFGQGTVPTIERVWAVVEDGVVVEYGATYVLEVDGTSYTVTERLSVEYPATFDEPEWVPANNATATGTGTASRTPTPTVSP